jgi:hypothetical protein
MSFQQWAMGNVLSFDFAHQSSGERASKKVAMTEDEESLHELSLIKGTSNQQLVTSN